MNRRKAKRSESHLNTDRARGHVPDTASLAVVELVRHALVLHRVGMDINNLADLVGLQVAAQSDLACTEMVDECSKLNAA